MMSGWIASAREICEGRVLDKSSTTEAVYRVGMSD
jgi:hypothetical protein